MKLDINKSIIHDTIKYFDIYFNYEKLKNDILSYNFDLDIAFKFYKKINNKFYINPNLHAFFALNKNQVSLLTQIFLQYNEKINTLHDFINLLSDKNCIINEISSYYLDEISPQNIISSKDIYNLYNIDEDVKLSLMAIITSPDNMITSLIYLFENVFDCVREIFNKNKQIINLFKIENYLDSVKETYNVSADDNTIYGISLIKPYSIRIHFRDEKYLWFLGYLCRQTLEIENPLTHVNAESIGNLFSNKVLTDILNIIKEHEEINPAKIFSLLPYELTRATAYRFITNLLSEKAIIISKKTGKLVYYKINKDYFRKVTIVISDICRYYYDNKDEMEDNK